MSIIYEALKKIEKNKYLQTNDKHTKPRMIYIFLLYSSVVLLGFFLGSHIFSWLNHKFFRNNMAKDSISDVTSVLKEPERKILSSLFFEEKNSYLKTQRKNISSVFQLSGIVYDPMHSYAIIDNRIFKEGDCIEEYCIEKILSDRVRLKSKDSQILELRLK